MAVSTNYISKTHNKNKVSFLFTNFTRRDNMNSLHLGTPICSCWTLKQFLGSYFYKKLTVTGKSCPNFPWSFSTAKRSIHLNLSVYTIDIISPAQ